MQLALSVPPSRAAQRTSPSAMSPALLPAARAAATRHATPRERAADPSASWSRTPQTPSDARTRKVWLSSRRSVVTSAASLMPPPRHSLPPRARATATCAMRPPQVRRHPQVGVGPQLRYPLWELQLPGSSGRGWDHHLPLAGWRVDGDAHLPAAPAAHAPARRVDSLHLFPPSSSRDLAEISTSPAESTFLCLRRIRCRVVAGRKSHERRRLAAPPCLLSPLSSSFSSSAEHRPAIATVDHLSGRALDTSGACPPGHVNQSTKGQPRRARPAAPAPCSRTHRPARRPRRSSAPPPATLPREATARLHEGSGKVPTREGDHREGRRLARADRITHGGGQSARGVQRRPWPTVAVEASREHVRRRAALAAYWTGCAVRAAASLQPRRGRALEDVCGVRCPVASAARVRLERGLSKAAPRPRAGTHGCVRSI